ncbi:MAG: DUF4286 family protein [Gemmatimonadaceae bacterium]|nr:DUF4286 family protein [Gemmatimonadaceae bacterium]
MVTYEITATVRADLADGYERFMREHHIPHLLATGAFAAATLSRSAPGRYRVRYEAHSRAALDRYLAEHAPRLRQEFTAAFPAGIELSREEWTVLAQWPSPAHREATA